MRNPQITLENIEVFLSEIREAANLLIRDKFEYAMSPATLEIFSASFSLKTGAKLAEGAHFSFKGHRIHELPGMPDNTILFTMPEEIEGLRRCSGIKSLKWDEFTGCNGEVLSNEFLEHQLGVAIEKEDYEWAARIRDELRRRKDIFDLEIGDKVMRRRSSDRQPEWVETTINETYYQLIREFPNDYKVVQ